MNSKILLSIAVALLPFTSRASVEEQTLDGNWKFRQARTIAWHDAIVPGTIHTDLMENNMIPDPFIGQNERDVQWVDKEDWIYQTSFDLDTNLAHQDNINLVFEGLDTYADVFLNDSLVLKADNMFRKWDIPVKEILKPEQNKLTVYFHSPIKIDIPKFESLPFQYDACNDQSQNGGIFDKRVSVFARKAGYHYGWDWGPRLVTSGIWRPVSLKAWSGPLIQDAYVRTNDIGKNKAAMKATVEIVADKDYSSASLKVLDSDSKKNWTIRNVSLKKGLNEFTLPFDVKNPKLWWCNGMGEPNLYGFNVVLSVNGNDTDEKQVVTGIRKIEVVREEDKDGRTFYFKLNGRPVFAKGANYIPCDNFLPRVTSEIYRHTVKDAADANMNMLRVWGGGIYEDDRFYNQCDSMGIMVWQDFMFACSLYPSEGEMLDNIKEEATYNVKRLRNHPSIALWCGNNECLEAWYNWGLKSRYEKQGFADIIWKQYVDLYHKVLPKVVESYNSEIFYWPSSPYSSIDMPSESNKGDTHMWRVWGGSEPIDLYNQVTSRFFSEYGFQSFPELQTVLKYAPDTTQHFIDSDVMLAHQRAGADANRRIEKYLLDSYPQPKDFNSFLYMSQVLQGDAIKTAIEAHRRNKPYCMGTLFWQHNDCWPVASWSSRDYYGNWKAQHYFSKKAYRDILLSVRNDGGNIKVHLVSDRNKKVKGLLNIDSYTLDGEHIGKFSQQVALPPDDVAVVDVPARLLMADADKKNIFLSSTFTTGADTYENVFFPVSQKDVEFSNPQISFDVEGDDGQYVVTLSSKNFVRALALSIPGGQKYFFEDNYFDMIPYKKYKVKLKSDMSREDIVKNLSMTSLYDATH